MIKMCLWCGRPFEAKTKRGVFCSPKCRKAHNRAQRGGMRLSQPTEPPKKVHARICEDDVAAAVVQAKGAASVFDAGRRSAPKDVRALCSKLADGMYALFDSVGI